MIELNAQARPSLANLLVGISKSWISTLYLNYICRKSYKHDLLLHNHDHHAVKINFSNISICKLTVNILFLNSVSLYRNGHQEKHTLNLEETHNDCKLKKVSIVLM